MSASLLRNGLWRHNEARGDNGGQFRSLQRREEAEFREVQGTWSEGWGARIGGTRIKVSATIYYSNLALPPHPGPVGPTTSASLQHFANAILASSLGTWSSLEEGFKSAGLQEDQQPVRQAGLSRRQSQ